MRKLAVWVVLVSMFAALVGCSSGQKTEGGSPSGTGSKGTRELLVLAYGGAYEDALRKHVHVFEEEFSAKVTFIPTTGADALVKARNKEVDVIFTEPIYSFQGEDEGLWERLEETTVPNSEDLYDIAHLSDYTLLHDLGAYVIAYNPDLVSPAPTSWLDLWKPEFVDKVTMRSFRSDSIELMVLMAKLNGGDERNMGPGFEKMAELNPSIHTWFTEHPQSLDLFRSEQVAIGLWTDARVNWAKSEGANIEYVVPNEGSFALSSTINVVKGTDKTDLALAYLNFEIGKMAQESIAETMGYFPVNRTAVLSQETAARTAFTPENVEQVQMADWRYVVTVMDEWKERWEKEVLTAK